MNILATGMVSAVGLSAAASCAAIRAKVSGMRELPIYHLGGSEVVGAPVPGCAADPETRLVELLCMAIDDCLGQLHGVRLAELPILVGLSEPGRPGGCSDPVHILAEAQKRLGVSFRKDSSAVVPRGNVAGFESLGVARRLAAPACLICAVDSQLNPAALHWLEQAWRLKTPENSDGVVPGEAAAAIVVGSPEAGMAGDLNANGQILGLGSAREHAHVLSEEPMLGLGLTQAAQQALSDASLEMEQMDFRISDLSGESYAFKEQALALARTLKVRKEDLPIWHCAESIGDTGAAAGICQLVIASHAFAKNYSPGDRAICYTSSVSGERAVAIVACADKRGQPRGGELHHGV